MTDATAPTRRNPLTTWLIPTACFFLAPVLGGLLGTTMFRFAPNAAVLAGLAVTFVMLSPMIKELSAASGGRLVAWHLFIPVYGIYWAAVVVRGQVAIAKQRAGKGEPRGLVVYLFLFLYALAADLNDLAPPA